MTRKEATEIIQKLIEASDLWDCTKEAEALRMAIEALSAERVGEWTAEIGYEGEVLYYECSNCKEAFSLLEGTPEENKYNYCPNCGAYMRHKGGDDE